MNVLQKVCYMKNTSLLQLSSAQQINKQSRNGLTQDTCIIIIYFHNGLTSNHCLLYTAHWTESILTLLLRPYNIINNYKNRF